MRAFPLVITALALSACAGAPLEWNATETGCEGYDYQPTDPTLSIRQDGGAVFVEFGCVLQPADARFEPVLDIRRNEIEISEGWSEGAEEDFPFTAQVELVDATGTLQVCWFRPGDEVAYDNVTFDVE